LAVGQLRAHPQGTRITIEVRVGDGARSNDWIISPKRLLEESDRDPVQISRIKAGKDDLKISVENAGPQTRVHVIGTRYLPGHSVFYELGREGLSSPRATFLSTARSAYVSGRDLGDEYRYILERKQSVKFPGNTLTRPGLLLNPWAVRSTETGVAVAAAGGEYDAEGAASMSAPAPCAKPQPAPGMAERSFASVDFLARPAAVLANLKPAPDGTVTVSRETLGASTQVRIIVVDPSRTLTRDHFLPEVTTDHRDLRLKLGLDPLGHFTEKKEVALLDAGRKIDIADLTATKLETYDTLARVFGLYRTLSGLAQLDAFEFILRWPKMTEDEKRAKYGEFACHELHFFLSKKDPDFFRKVVQPYLRNKKDKTFMDRYLVEDDLSDFRRPWEFGRLNILERILLGRRIDDEHDPVGRHAGDRCDLLPIDLARDEFLFDTALKGKALEAGDELGLAAATDGSREDGGRGRAFGGGGMGAMRSMAAPASTAPAEMDEVSFAAADRDDATRAVAKKSAAAGPSRSRAAAGKMKKDLRRREQRASSTARSTRPRNGPRTTTTSASSRSRDPTW
jgi:hypothetical protein